MDFTDKFNFLKNNQRLPQHIGIIMDGNGRWAKSRGLSRVAGHNEGINSVHDIVEVCGELEIGYLTIYTFSEENWKRPGREVASLMQLLVTTIKKHLPRLIEQNVRIRTIGHLHKLPDITRRSMEYAVERTRGNTGLNLNVALSYGGRQEITDAFRKLARLLLNGELQPEDICENNIAAQLNTSGQPDPDLIIRTGGEYRLSNFLLWQIAYSEIYITRTAWPEFRKPQFIEALWDYVYRERRFGMVSEQLPADLALQNA